MNDEVNIENEEKTIKSELGTIVDKSNYLEILGIILAIAPPLGASYFLRLTYTWIPSSFLLIALYSIYAIYHHSLLYRNILRDKNNFDKSFKKFKQFKKEHKMHQFSLLINNAKPLFIAIGIIYFINLCIILLYLSDFITLQLKTAELIFVGLLSASLASSIFLVGRIEKYYEKLVLPKMQGMKQFDLRYLLGAIILGGAFVIIYIWMFIRVMTLVSNWGFLLITLILQFVSVTLMFSLFSRHQIETGLKTILSKLLMIKEKTSNENPLDIIKFSRYAIEKYLFVQVYLYVPHHSYLEEVTLGKHKRKLRK